MRTNHVITSEMAKELPYFKFEPQEWESGMIQLCSLQSKGLFIEICCLYWNRLGNLPYAFALHKLCNGSTELLQELESNGIYTINDDLIVIQFLDEQLDEFQKISKKRRLAANERWNNTKEMQLHSKSNAIREDKIREEKIREDIPPFEEFLSYARENKKNVDVPDLKLKYESWNVNGWQTGGSKPRKIINWKTTLLNTLPYLKEGQQSSRNRN